MRENIEIRQLIEDKWITMFREECKGIRTKAREKIAEVQAQNRKLYDKKRKEKKLRDTNEEIWLQLNGHRQIQDWNFVRSFLDVIVWQEYYAMIHTLCKKNWWARRATSTAVDHLKLWVDDGSLFEDTDSNCKNIWGQMLNQDGQVS